MLKSNHLCRRSWLLAQAYYLLGLQATTRKMVKKALPTLRAKYVTQVGGKDVNLEAMLIW
jgi:hypothetical protein